MRCPFCQTPHQADATICDHCGREFSQKRSTVLESVPPPVGVSSTPPPILGGGVFQPPPDSKRRTVVEAETGPVGSPFGSPFAAALQPAPAGGFARPAGGHDPFSNAMPGAGGKRATMIDVGDDARAPAKEGAPALDRRVIGWIVTFDPDPNGRSFPLLEGRNTIGRDAANEIAVPDPKMSGKHATIQHRGGRTWLYDENSNNGTFLNGEDIFQERPGLKDGDVFRLGATRFIVKLLDPEQVARVFAPKGS